MSDSIRKIQIGSVEYQLDLDAPLGTAGGFGHVVEATGPDSAQLAAKIVPLTPGTHEKVFYREIDILERVMAAPDSDRLVKVYGATRDGDDLIIVMQRADGSLADLLQDGSPLDESQAVGFGLDVALALQDLHEIGVIHRDLKPANVLLTAAGLKLADFGISRDVAEDTATVTFAAAGTPPYMAPEQWRGESSSVKTDLYALGCMLHQLVAGQPPFQCASTEEYRLAHLEQPPPPIDGLTDQRLGALIDRLLSKKPGERPQDARAVVERLQLVASPLESDTMREIASAVAALERERGDRAAEQAAADRLAGEHQAIVEQALGDLSELVTDSAELLGAALTDVSPSYPQGRRSTFENATWRIESREASICLIQWTNVGAFGELGASSHIPLSGELTIGLTGRGNADPAANLAYQRIEGRWAWQAYQFTANALIRNYRLGPVDRPHGFPAPTWCSEIELGHGPFLTGMHVYQTHRRTEASAQVVAELVSEAITRAV